MSRTDVAPGIAGTESGNRAEGACAACRHELDSHDVIARRYCAATVAGGFHRGCVCVGEPKKEAEQRHRQ
jgi:hypothetical protein